MNAIRNTLSLRRNLGIIAHIDAGKTTLTERLLWKTGAIHRMGEVHDGNATTDFSPIERQRGITIGAAAVQAQWSPEGRERHHLTLIDTPGHIDFGIEVERSLRVLDGAVAVFSAVDGVQPQSETVWRQARRHGVPLMAFVNKMDRPGASFERTLEQMRSKLDANPWAIGLPLGDEGSLDGWVDLVGCRVERWDASGSRLRSPWDESEAAMYAELRHRLVESVAEHDDELAHTYLEGLPVDEEQLRAAIRRGTLACLGVPVLAGSAIRNRGIENLLDAIVDYLPSPLDRPPVQAESETGTVALSPDPSGPLAGLVFKIARVDEGVLTFVRVYSGTMKVGDKVWCSHQRRTRRVGRLAVVQADHTRDIVQAQAGDIVAILGWKDAVSGETLGREDQRLALDSIQAQPAVLSWKLTAEQSSDLIRLGQGLASLAHEDPSFRIATDPDTGETLVWGMGELHLDVMIERLRTEWNVKVRVGSPRVAYQETPRMEARGIEGRLSKQTGGPGQVARVVIDMAPREDGEVVFEDRTKGGVMPASFVNATEKGIRAALSEGPRGYPVVGVAVTLIDGETHAVDSSEAAFQRAGSEAIRQALAQAGTVLLEPVMEVAIETPSTNVGDVVGDLQRRLGRVLSIEDKGARTDVVAHAPLAKLDGYATALRSLTEGRASASVAFNRYEAARTT